MGLDMDIINRFAKMIQPEKERKKEYTYYGTVKSVDKSTGKATVRIDGSNYDTPCVVGVSVHQDDRVLITNRNRQAIVTSNISSAEESMQPKVQTFSLSKLNNSEESAVIQNQSSIVCGYLKTEVGINPVIVEFEKWFDQYDKEQDFNGYKIWTTSNIFDIKDSTKFNVYIIDSQSLYIVPELNDENKEITIPVVLQSYTKAVI